MLRGKGGRVPRRPGSRLALFPRDPSVSRALETPGGPAPVVSVFLRLAGPPSGPRFHHEVRTSLCVYRGGLSWPALCTWGSLGECGGVPARLSAEGRRNDLRRGVQLSAKMTGSGACILAASSGRSLQLLALLAQKQAPGPRAAQRGLALGRGHSWRG